MSLLDEASTDWLNSRPVFYNEHTGAISNNINEVIDYNNIRFHPEGFNNYLRFGYSVFGQTMLEGIKFLRWSSSIKKDEKGSLKISYDADPAEKAYGKLSMGGEAVINEILEIVRAWANESEKKVLLPLSGGYDSKLLAYALSNMEKVYAFSYGYSRNQYDSYEVVKAQKTAGLCNIKWSHVPLGDYFNNQYINAWDSIFGISVHSHGEYQMEFYNTIISDHTDLSGQRLLSGIIGDAWAGNVWIPDVNSGDELENLSYSHGFNADVSVSQFRDNGDVRNAFYEKYKDKLREVNWRIIFSMRMKMMLLSYLIRVPESYGLECWSPFLKIDTAMHMLNLDWEEKRFRKWQTVFFTEKGMHQDWLKKECDYNSDIDAYVMIKNPLEPLNVSILSQVVKPEFVEWINREIAKKPLRYFAAYPRTPKNILNKFVRIYNKPILNAVSRGFRLLKPVEILLKKADKQEKIVDNSI